MTADPVVIGVVVVLLGGLGLIVGSFLNVVIYRVPRDLSIVRPGSACPGCGTPISARDNIPVAVLAAAARPLPHLRGADLRALPARRGTQRRALARAGLVGRGGPTASTRCCPGCSCWAVPAWPCGSSTSSTTGCRTRSCCRCTRWASSDWCSPASSRAQWPLSAVAIGVGAWLVVIGGIWLLTGGRAMGFGDVKLAPVLAATLGWVGVSSALVGLLAAFVLGGGVGSRPHAHRAGPARQPHGLRAVPPARGPRRAALG